MLTPDEAVRRAQLDAAIARIFAPGEDPAVMLARLDAGRAARPSSADGLPRRARCPRCCGYCTNGAQCGIAQLLGRRWDWRVNPVADLDGDCPDGGACHHGCGKGCFRVAHAGPLTVAGWGDSWPGEVTLRYADTDGVL